MLSLRGSVWLILAKPPHVCLHEAPLAPLAPPATHALGHPSIEVRAPAPMLSKSLTHAISG